MGTKVDQGKLPDISDFYKKDEAFRPGFRKNLIKHIQQYTDYTGIHGLRYVAENRRHIFERLCWTISFCGSLIMCILLTIDTWKKWDTSPVLVSFSKTPTSIWRVPFPALTICPQTKSKFGLYNYTESLNKFAAGETFTDMEMKNFTISSLVCDNYMYSSGNKTIHLEALNHIIDIAPQIPDIFFQCRWDLHVDNCSASFTKVLTEDGLCYTSNMLGKNELFKEQVYLPYHMVEKKNTDGWTLDNGYPDTAKKDSYPRRAKFSGFTGSQVLVLKDFDQHLDYSCKGPVQGYKIILHHPGEMPRVSMNYLQASLDEELLVIITPDMMQTSKNVREYDPHKRECFFPKERYLAFFQIYTQQNCEFECLTNYTLSKCGCVAFYMPYNKSTPICGPGSLKCMLEAQSELIHQTVDYVTDASQSDNRSEISGFACGCLPGCSSLSYNAEFSQTHFNWRELFMAFREDMNELPGVYFSRLTLFFKESQFIPAERDEIFGLVDFLANCGGILGLFTGFSFLSLVEILYFLSLRLMCNIKMYGRHYWSGSKLLQEDRNY